MTSRGELVIVGAGGLGREVLDVALACGSGVDFFADDTRAGETIRGLPVIYPSVCPSGASYIVGIADPAARRRLAALLDAVGLRSATLVHPRAVIAPETTLGAGSLIMANAHISSSITIGAHCQVHYNATVGHDAVLEDFVSVYPGANVSGSVQLGEGATVGSNAVVLQGRRVGANAFIGAGAVVTRDVPGGTVVVGSPARSLKPDDR